MAENASSYTRATVNSVPLKIRVMCQIVKFASYLTRRSDGTVNRRLSKWLERRALPNEKPAHGVYTRDIVIDNVTGVWLRLFVPVEATGEKIPVVVYFHGGGFCALSAADVVYDVFCRRLARRSGVLVASVDYRLAPEHKYPAAYEDCFAALAWLRSNSGVNHLPAQADLSRCFLMGDSAGGNIVHHVGCRVAEGKEDLRPVRVLGHVLIQPYFGGEERTAAEVNLKEAPLITVENSDWYWRAFLPEGANKDHPAANVVGSNCRDISGLAVPPSLVVIGGLDILQDWQSRYAEYLRKMGKDVEVLWYDNAVHAFHAFPGFDLAKKFLDDVDGFIHRTLAKVS
ncbi:hypothetical protein SUGI_0905300 [Cryptomeria japonica]|uniref:probable carboxylesterase 18 n=1 Tax=Cryptomeria japonica TaxID=3369 RepID=UPI002414CAFE|nr:probable carboxylesterase 18 [Cryptomeria japonica]GLJ43534.1 hypothetical protein SUGI_0905300 [Cryptomeria japonica]